MMSSDNSKGFAIVDKDGAAHLGVRESGAHNGRVSDYLFKVSIEGWFDEC